MQSKFIYKMSFKHVLRVAFILFFSFNYSQTINWMSLEKAIESQKNNPKNILVDVYTNWCGPCKLMDKNTFQNKEIARFINEHYYAVKFNGEGNEIVSFRGREFSNIEYDESKSQRRNSSHQFTQFLGISAYPTTLFFDKEMNFLSLEISTIIEKKMINDITLKIIFGNLSS